MQVRPDVGGAGERLMGVAFGRLRLTLRDRHPAAHGQRLRQVPAGRGRHRLVGPTAGRDQIPAGQRGPRTDDAPHRRSRGQDTHVLPGRLGRVQRCRSIAGGQGRGSQRRVGVARGLSAKLGGGLDGRVGGGPGRTRVTLPRQYDALAREAIRPPDLIVSCLSLNGHRAEIVRRLPPDRRSSTVPIRGTSGTGAT